LAGDLLESKGPFSEDAQPLSDSKMRRARPTAFPVFVPRILAAFMPALTRSRINSRSNCATAARPPASLFSRGWSTTFRDP
jgi:hypothetical protein